MPVNDDHLPDELRGTVHDPRGVDRAGLGLSIYDGATSVRRHRLEWVRRLTYAAVVVIAGATILKVIAGK